LLSFCATVVVWVDGEGLLPITTVCLVRESNNQAQSQRKYLPLLDLSTKQEKQQASTLHIGTHILSESSKDNAQTRYQLTSHLQSNTLELDEVSSTLLGFSATIVVRMDGDGLLPSTTIGLV
jgi:Trp operon repressor